MRVGSLIETSNEYKLAEIALNEYIYNEDISLLEAYAEGDIGFLLEATDEEKRLGLSKREIKRRRKLELIPQELSIRRVGNLYNSRPQYDELEDNFYPNLDPESLKKKPYEKNKKYGHQEGINAGNKENIAQYAGRKYGFWSGLHVNRSKRNLENLKQKGIPVKNYKQIHKVLGNNLGAAEFVTIGDPNINRVNIKLKQKGYKPVTIEDLRSPNFVLHKDSDSDTPKQPTTPPSSKPKEQAKEIAQVVKNEEPPKPEVKPQQPISQPKSEQPLSQQEKVETMKKMQQKTQKVLDTSEHQPKSVLARMVSSLQHLYREWLDKKNQAKANGQDVGFFSNILRVILNCIDKLMWKIRNWSDGRKSKHYNSK